MPSRVGRVAGLLAALGVLGLVALTSLAVGAENIPLATVWHALWDPGSDGADVVRSLRAPRTALGLAVGAALGIAGALMQSLTRNPLADPGLLGVNAGASAAVVIAIGVVGVRAADGYVWFALGGAAIAAVAVYFLGTRGRPAATPVRMTLAGAAISAALTAVVSGLTLSDPTTFNSFRFWAVGSLAGRGSSVLADTGPFLLLGGLLALVLARPLNALALGDDTGRALGARVVPTRVGAMIAVTLLAGAATAAAGPIGFVGLCVPHVARAITGPDQRWILAYSAVLAPVLVVAADVLGRVTVRPGELEVGVVTAFIGAPALILLARRTKLVRA